MLPLRKAGMVRRGELEGGMEGREERGGVLMKGQLKCTAHTASARNAHSNFMVNWAMHLESYITEAYRETQCQIRKTHTHTHSLEHTFI